MKVETCEQKRTFRYFHVDPTQAEAEVAYAWWNNLCGKNMFLGRGLQIHPQINDIIFALINFSRPLLLIYDGSETDDVVYQRFHRVVAVLTERKDIPDPLTKFPQFIVSFYQNRDKITVKTPEQAIKLLECLPHPADPNFLMWKYPEAISNPELYIQTIFLMNKTQNHIWKVFISLPGSIDLIFDRFMPLLGPKTTVCCIELLTLLIVERFRLFTNQDQIVSQFWEHLIPLLTSHLQDVVLAAFRALSFLFFLTRPKLSQHQLTSRLKQIIDETQDHQFLRIIVASFVLRQEVSSFKPSYLMKNGIKSPLDFQVIAMIFSYGDVSKRLPYVQMVFEAAVSDIIYLNLSIQTLSELLPKTKQRDWISVFIRRAFQFVVLSQHALKYENRAHLIMVFMERLYQINIEWLSSLISKYFSILKNTGSNVLMYHIREESTLTDPNFISEIDTFKKNKINIKTMLSKIQEPSQSCFPPVAGRAKSMKRSTVVANHSSRPSITSPANVRSSALAKKGVRPKSKSLSTVFKSQRVSFNLNQH